MTLISIPISYGLAMLSKYVMSKSMLRRVNSSYSINKAVYILHPHFILFYMPIFYSLNKDKLNEDKIVNHCETENDTVIFM